ncbi:glycosyltransferase family 4 protein [Terrabacter sp. MAHUQ-38]|uniref:glycosyltransferase family 4 protein n=1 Tax=unclassified Terrabacter TaxID=2630222 RepID=UPI00165D5D1A|nr:glycosyltransferase family 4 protein [Terrabacter sp. MAHUQ-38]
MTDLHVIVPAGIHDPARPSGGNTYDRHLVAGLRDLGWQVHEHEVVGAWPHPVSAALAGLAAVLAEVPGGALVLVDGLVGCCADGVLVPEADRLRLVVLVHMPLGPTVPGAAAGERRVLSAASAVVTPSAWSRELLLDTCALDPEAVHVARPGVDARPVAPGSASGGELLCVAAVTPHKGHTDLADALTLVADLPWRCVCAGSLALDPARVADVRDRLSRAGLSERVGFPGPLAGVALDEAYAAADLLVLPSLTETYGMVVTEALARGIPVLATAVGGVPEAIGSEGGPPGLLVPSGRPDLLADALRSWLGDDDLRSRLRRRAVERRLALTPWSGTAAEVSGVLERVWAV